MAAAAVFLADPRLSAQQIPGQELPPPALVATPTPTPSKRASEPTLKLRLSAQKLRAAVEELQNALEGANMPGINVVFGTNVDDVSIPDLTLRNVSGADALRLIAAASGCRVEPIIGEDGTRAIGQMISAAAAGADPFAYAPVPGPAPGPFGGPPTAGRTPILPDANAQGPGPAFPGGAPNLLGGGAGGGFDPSGNPPNAFAGAAPGVNPIGAGGGVIGFGTPVSTRNVRVYPLASITTMTTFADVEKTLRELLKAEEIAADAAKLAMHEKTNVLVVTGDEQVHRVVSQLLEALQKNTAAATVRNNQEERGRLELMESRVRLEAMQHENKRLDVQLQEAESKLRDLQRELDRAKATDPKPR